MLTSKRFRLALLIALAMLLVTALSCFLLRNQLLQWGIQKVSKRFETSQGLLLHIEQAEFVDIRTVRLSTLVVQAQHSKDTILSINELELGVHWSLSFAVENLIESVKLNTVVLQLNTLKQHLSNHKGAKPIDSVEVKPPTTPKTEKAYHMLARVKSLLPNQVLITNARLEWQDSLDQVTLEITEAQMKDQHFNIRGSWSDHEVKQSWSAIGTVDAQTWSSSITINPLESEALAIPWIKNKLGLSLGFQALTARLEGVELQNHKLNIRGRMTIRDPLIEHKRLAEEPLQIDSISTTGNITISDKKWSLDTGTIVTLNTLNTYPQVAIDLKSSPQIVVHFRTDTVPAQQLLETLPQRVFNTLEGMQLGGDLAYSFDLKFDAEEPDSVFLEAGFYKKRFQVKRWGKAFLPQLNEPFTYTAYENEKAQRSWVIGPENPDFVPLGDVSSYLTAAILTAEDPSFYRHRGFVPEAIRQSIAINYKQRKFKRGASTISMQLTKNLYLSRKKVLIRKLEEMLLTWIMENSYVVSKERLFEIYLNIIEWGPNVYGVGEASEYYFSKKPNELTLAESIYLASIIPSPKKFKWKFDEQGNLRDYMAGFYRICSKRMVHRELISPIDTIGLRPEVTLKGPARVLIIKTDSLPEDSVVLPLFGPE